MRISIIILLLSLSSCMLFRSSIEVGNIPQDVEDEFIEAPEESFNIRVEEWQTGLEVPWSLVFLDDESALVSERPGRIRIIQNGVLSETPYATVDARDRGEGGLMGLAVHPDFPDEPYIYAMYTYRSWLRTRNKVVRFEHFGDSGENKEVVVNGIPGGRFHNGGRIAFGPDGKLYITTGENFRPRRAQNPANLGGKILRFTPEGDIPGDNPVDGSPVYSKGHRNVQGITWDSDGRMFASEHGPTGEYRLQGKDLIHRITPGGNYGWPEKIGQTGQEKFEDPLIMWEPATPPGGLTFWENDLYVATMRSRALIRIILVQEDETITVTGIERWFATGKDTGVYGRFRDVVTGPDGALYVTTSNRDGRGSPSQGDDKILRISRN